MTKQKQFVEMAHKEVENHSCYLWGGQGESVLKTLPETIVKKETSQENAGRVLALVSKFVKVFEMGKAKYFDCSGLVTWCLQQMGLIKGDYTANKIYNELCYAIQKEDLKGGDLCFKSDNGKMVHVGIYSKKHGVIEAAGRDLGVVERPIDANKWTSYGRLRCLK